MLIIYYYANNLLFSNQNVSIWWVVMPNNFTERNVGQMTNSSAHDLQDATHLLLI